MAVKLVFLGKLADLAAVDEKQVPAPLDWAGLLAAFCLEHGVPPRGVRARRSRLDEFQTLLRQEGIELEWRRVSPL